MAPQPLRKRGPRPSAQRAALRRELLPNPRLPKREKFVPSLRGRKSNKGLSKARGRMLVDPDAQERRRGKLAQLAAADLRRHKHHVREQNRLARVRRNQWRRVEEAPGFRQALKLFQERNVPIPAIFVIPKHLPNVSSELLRAASAAQSLSRRTDIDVDFGSWLGPFKRNGEFHREQWFRLFPNPGDLEGNEIIFARVSKVAVSSKGLSRNHLKQLRRLLIMAGIELHPGPKTRRPSSRKPIEAPGFVDLSSLNREQQDLYMMGFSELTDLRGKGKEKETCCTMASCQEYNETDEPTSPEALPEASLPRVEDLKPCVGAPPEIFQSRAEDSGTASATPERTNSGIGDSGCGTKPKIIEPVAGPNDLGGKVPIDDRVIGAKVIVPRHCIEKAISEVYGDPETMVLTQCVARPDNDGLLSEAKADKCRCSGYAITRVDFEGFKPAAYSMPWFKPLLKFDAYINCEANWFLFAARYWWAIGIALVLGCSALLYTWWSKVIVLLVAYSVMELAEIIHKYLHQERFWGKRTMGVCGTYYAEARALLNPHVSVTPSMRRSQALAISQKLTNLPLRECDHELRVFSSIVAGCSYDDVGFQDTPPIGWEPAPGDGPCLINSAPSSVGGSGCEDGGSEFQQGTDLMRSGSQSSSPRKGRKSKCPANGDLDLSTLQSCQLITHPPTPPSAQTDAIRTPLDKGLGSGSSERPAPQMTDCYESLGILSRSSSPGTPRLIRSPLLSGSTAPPTQSSGSSSCCAVRCRKVPKRVSQHSRACFKTKVSERRKLDSALVQEQVWVTAPSGMMKNLPGVVCLPNECMTTRKRSPHRKQ